MSDHGSDTGDRISLKGVFIASSETLAEKADSLGADSALDLQLERVYPGSEKPAPGDVDVVLLYLAAEEDLNLVTELVDLYASSVHKWLICKRRRYYMHIALLKDFNLRIDMDFDRLYSLIHSRESALRSFLNRMSTASGASRIPYAALEGSVISVEQYNEAVGGLEDSGEGLSAQGLREWVRAGLKPGPLTSALLAFIKKGNLLRGYSQDLKKLFDPDFKLHKSAYSMDVSVSCGAQSFEPELSLEGEVTKGAKETLRRLADIGVLFPHEQESFAALSFKIRPGVSNEMVQDYFNNLLLKLQLLPHVLPPRYRDELAKVSMVYNFKSKIRDGRAYIFLLFDFFVLLTQTSRRELKELESLLTIIGSEATEGKISGSLSFKTGLAGMLNDPRKDLLVHLLESFRLTLSASTSSSLKSMIIELLQNWYQGIGGYLALLPVSQKLHLNFANFRELPDELMRKMLDQLKPKGAQTMAGIWRLIAMKICRKRNMYSVLKYHFETISALFDLSDIELFGFFRDITLKLHLAAKGLERLLDLNWPRLIRVGMEADENDDPEDWSDFPKFSLIFNERH
jgi:hypothetical protein